MNLDYFLLLSRTRPEWILLATALFVLGADLGLWSSFTVSLRKTLCALVTTAGAWIAWRFLSSMSSESSVWYGGMWVQSPEVKGAKYAILGLLVATAWLTRETRFTRHIGEYFALLILSAIGMCVVSSTDHVLLAFVGLELLSLSLYVLTAWSKEQPSSTEAGLNYFLFGGIAAAALLYGISVLYGVSGELQLSAMAAKLAGKSTDLMALVGMVLVVAGLGFKIAAAPFHLWAPTTYESAPTSTAAFIASGSKVASFLLLTRIATSGWTPLAGSGAWHGFVAGWIPLLAAVAAASLVIGNWVAIAQVNLKRLVAFSAVAQTGYVLVGLLANSSSGNQAVLFYVVSYAVATMGVFALIATLERRGPVQIGDCAGLVQRSPFLAGCLLVYLLSFAGIPPFAGFFGKFYLFLAALQSKDASMGLLWLVLLALAMSSVALYYYLKVLKQAFVVAAPENAPRIEIRWATRVLLAASALATLLWGLFPEWLLRGLR